MTQKTQDLATKLIPQHSQGKLIPKLNTELQGMELKRPTSIPAITLSGLSLCILCPILIAAHIFIADLTHIPLIQYIFVTLLVAFIVNYIFLIRKFQIQPFLEQQYDNQLKIACVLGFAGICCSLMWGWNGSGGIIFAIFWEKIRGNKMGTFTYLYAIIVIGSLLMEKHFTILKLIQFIPGILFGIANSIIFTLKESSTYVLAHQFIFLTSMLLPMFFPLNHLHVPSLFQWFIMIVTGISMLFTVLLTVKLMQGERVSIVMAVMSGLIMIGTSSYSGSLDFVGAILILMGVIFVVKKEYLDLQF